MNDGISPREAALVITGGGMTQTIRIYQEGSGYLTVSTTEVSFAANQYSSFNIMSNINWSISQEGGGGWLSVNPMSGYGDKEITLRASNQQYIGPHYATLIISGYGITQTVNVTLYDTIDNIGDKVMDKNAGNHKTIYDLSGRRTTYSSKDISKLPHGVYLIDGKKIVIRNQ